MKDTKTIAIVSVLVIIALVAIFGSVAKATTTTTTPGSAQTQGGVGVAFLCSVFKIGCIK